MDGNAPQKPDITGGAGQIELARIRNIPIVFGTRIVGWCPSESETWRRVDSEPSVGPPGWNHHSAQRASTRGGSDAAPRRRIPVSAGRGSVNSEVTDAFHSPALSPTESCTEHHRDVPTFSKHGGRSRTHFKTVTDRVGEPTALAVGRDLPSRMENWPGLAPSAHFLKLVLR
jgi:hypothetical protein